MNCKAVGSLLSEYLSDDLSPQRARAVEDHLKQCQGCRNELAVLERAAQALERPLTVMEAPDVLGAVRARVQDHRQTAFRLVAAWGFAGVVALMLTFWAIAWPLAPVSDHDSATVTIDTNVKNHRQSPEPRPDAVEDMSTPKAPTDDPTRSADIPRRIGKSNRQMQHQFKTPAKQLKQDSAIADTTDQVATVEMEQPEVVAFCQVQSSKPGPAPGELRYECVNGQGYVYRELPPGPDWGPQVRADVMIVPNADMPDPRYILERDSLDRLASAGYATGIRQGAILP